MGKRKKKKKKRFQIRCPCGRSTAAVQGRVVSCRLCAISSKLTILFWQHGTGLSILQASIYMKKTVAVQGRVVSCRLCAITSKLTVLFWQHGTETFLSCSTTCFFACIYLSICVCIYTITVQCCKVIAFSFVWMWSCMTVSIDMHIGEYACVFLCLSVPLCWRLSVYVAFANLYGTEVQ